MGRMLSVVLAVIAVSMPMVSSAETRDIYSEINVKGEVTVSIADDRGQSRCARLWWVTRLTGGVRQLGVVCGRKTIDIPSFLGISLASKLRASADRGIIITVSAQEGVARTITFGL